MDENRECGVLTDAETVKGGMKCAAVLMMAAAFAAAAGFAGGVAGNAVSSWVELSRSEKRGIEELIDGLQLGLDRVSLEVRMLKVSARVREKEDLDRHSPPGGRPAALKAERRDAEARRPPFRERLKVEERLQRLNDRAAAESLARRGQEAK